MGMKTWIAERKLIAEVSETGECKDVTIRIGMPFWLLNDDFASCPVEWQQGRFLPLRKGKLTMNCINGAVTKISRLLDWINAKLQNGSAIVHNNA